MKQLIIGIGIGALLSAGVLSFTRKPVEGEASVTEKSTERDSSSHYKSIRDSGESARFATVKSLSKKKDGQSRLALMNEVYALDMQGLEELLSSEDVLSVSIYDTTGSHLLSSIFTRMVSLSPEKALENMEALPGHIQRRVSHSLFLEWAETDVESALKAVKSLKNPRGKQAGIGAVLGKLAETDPDRALQIANEEGNNWNTKFSVLSAIGKTDPRRALELSKELGQQGQWARQTLLSMWVMKDPTEALQYATSLDNKVQKQQAITGVINGIASSDLDRAYALLEQHKGELGSDQLQMVTSTLASYDPDRALANAEKIENKAQRKTAIMTVIQQLGNTDPDKAVELLSKYEDLVDGRNIQVLAYTLGRSAPEKALQWLEEKGNKGQYAKAFSYTLSQWMQSDERAALTYFEGISDPAVKYNVGKALLSTLSYQRPDLYLKVFEKSEGKLDKNNFREFKQAVSKLAQNDYPAAKLYVETLSDPETKRGAISGLLETLARSDADEAVKYAQQLPGKKERDYALGGVLQTLTWKDPEKAAEIIADNDYKTLGDFSVNSFISQYVRSDLEGAKTFYQSIPDPLIKDKAVSSLIREMGKDDPSAALEFALNQEQTEGIHNSLTSIGQQYAKQNPTEGLNEIMKQSPGEARSKVVSSFFERWATTDRDAALEALSRTEVSAATQSRVYERAGASYAREPENGQRWLSSLPEGAAKNSATNSFISTWSRNQPNEAAEWVNELPNGNQRDGAVKSLVGAFDNAEPAYALEWASTITDQATKKSTLSSSYNSWKKRDAEAAEVWLNSTNVLSPKEKQELSK